MTSSEYKRSKADAFTEKNSSYLDFISNVSRITINHQRIEKKLKRNDKFLKIQKIEEGYNNQGYNKHLNNENKIIENKKRKEKFSRQNDEMSCRRVKFPDYQITNSSFDTTEKNLGPIFNISKINLYY